jgi:hypothetical protein
MAKNPLENPIFIDINYEQLSTTYKEHLLKQEQSL